MAINLILSRMEKIQQAETRASFNIHVNYISGQLTIFRNYVCCQIETDGGAYASDLSVN